jgi:hypothetical protein
MEIWIMQIMKRAKSGGELIPFNESSETVKEEANLRASKAGFCTRHGDPIYGTKIMGPGIGESKLNIWPRDENGNLIDD